MRRDWAALQRALDAALGRATMEYETYAPPPLEPRSHRTVRPAPSPTLCDRCGQDTRGTWMCCPERADGKLCMTCGIKAIR